VSPLAVSDTSSRHQLMRMFVTCLVCFLAYGAFIDNRNGLRVACSFLGELGCTLG